MQLAVILIATMTQAAAPGLLLPAYGDVDASAISGLESALREKLNAHIELAAESETIAQLKGAEELGMCPAKVTSCPTCSAQDFECAAGLNETTGAKTVFVLSAKTSGSIVLLDLTEVDALTKAVKRQGHARVRDLGESATFAAVQQERQRAAAALVVQLFSPEGYVASLEIEGEAGCEARVDETSIGVLPLNAPVEGVAPGEHTVSMTCIDGKTQNKTAYAAFGDVTRFDFNAAPTSDDDVVAADAGFSPYVYVLGAGAAVAALAVVTAVAGVGLQAAAYGIFGTSNFGAAPTANIMYWAGLGMMVGGLFITIVGGGVAGVGGALMGME